MQKLARHASVAIATLLVLMLAPLSGLAHESRPAYLQLTEHAAGVFEVLWRRPARGDRVLALRPKLPDFCAPGGEVASYPTPGSVTQRWSVDCGGQSLVGHTIYIEGLTVTITDVLLRVELRDGVVYTQILRANSPAYDVPPKPSAFKVMVDYLLLGIEHILGGVDHLLFVLGLLLIVHGNWLLVKTITAFTVAHSITLAMATLGFVHMPQAPVEAVIALSILFLASELARQRHGSPGLTERYPWIVAFVFGLLHGFGFAGALTEVGLPQSEIPLALLMFNVGVEVGQLLFVAAVLAVGMVFRRLAGAAPDWWPRATAYGIGSVA
ncbi:MAG: HupE/UreJ family protein, partial [Pseudomonadota bacterium]